MRKVIAVAAASAGAVVLLAANANPALAQPTVNAAWPMCASPSATYCILAATRDGEAVDAANNGPYEGGVLVPWAMFTDTNTVAWGMKWSLDETSLPGSVGGSILSMTLRLGSIRPMYTMARAMAFRMDNVAQNGGSWEMTVTGSSATVDWLVNSANPNCFTDPDACEPNTVTADVHRRLFQGSTDNMGVGWDDVSKAMFGGMYIASNAQYVQRVVESGKLGDGGSFWAVRLANPHNAVDGKNTSGEFTAWIPESFFTQQSGITANSAATKGLVANTVRLVWQKDGNGQWTGVQTYFPIPSGSKLYNGGVYSRITTVGYSSPKITFNTKTGGYLNSEVTNYVPPDPPILSGLSQASGIVTISYKPPVFDGNSAINGYIGYCEQNNKLYWNAVDQGYTRAIAVAGMQQGQAYCWVKAKNEGGESLESETVAIDVGEAPPVFTEPPKSSATAAATGTKSTTSLWMPPTQSAAASSAAPTKTASAAASSVAATSSAAAATSAAPQATTAKPTTTSVPTSSASGSATTLRLVFVALSAVVAAVAIL